MEFIEEKYPNEIATRLYELTEDMDHMDYEDTKEETIQNLENVLYNLREIARNERNGDNWRLLYTVLQKI